jgi:hypothetical protein
MRSFLIFVTGAVLGFIIAEIIGVFAYLLYAQTIGMKFFPLFLGALLVGIDIVLKKKSKSPIYKSSLRY